MKSRWKYGESFKTLNKTTESENQRERYNMKLRQNKIMLGSCKGIISFNEQNQN